MKTREDLVEIFFDLPWFIPAAVAITGIALFLWANARLRKRERAIGLGLVGLALLMAIVSYLIDTPRETVEKRTRMFVAAVVAKDSSAMGDLLAGDAIAFSWDKQDIIDGAIHYAEATGLTGARLLSLQGVKEGNTLFSYMTVWSQHSGTTSFPIADLNSQWKLEWIKEGDKWRVIEIVPLQIGQTSREAIERSYLDRPVKAR